MQIRLEEIFRASEADLCRKPGRLHKVAQRILHGLIVINDRKSFGLAVRVCPEKQRDCPTGSNRTLGGQN